MIQGAHKTMFLSVIYKRKCTENVDMLFLEGMLSDKAN